MLSLIRPCGHLVDMSIEGLTLDQVLEAQEACLQHPCDACKAGLPKQVIETRDEGE